ncbi:DUF605-domain-containing protein [Durotheca rogersii]|uniref:DUF605-domain-containing protein n=1 Tax=Durotheca rogersii TaxID=419775 RepID=UPI00221EA024|nr:DUF605-domain-containing protein [Durotheca rogersii]KAI5865776.1 DUF605-domain-containing protein [Durotheca rogersii]
MAANIPAKLKQAGITPFVVRATQLETAKPVMSYWCLYWAVNQILEKQLHSADDDCLKFTTTLMEKLEKTKDQQAGNDAILDDAAGQAYVEQFAQETFERALRPLKANRVTQQTASTFEAAATFFQLVNIWGLPDAETQVKIKYSKWNAARILKAIKEGKDPNESNPKDDEAKQDEAMPLLDPADPEVKTVLRMARPSAATVEDASDDEARLRLPSNPYSRTSPTLVSAPTSPPGTAAMAPEQVSPIVPPGAPTSDPGSYFPDAPGQATLDLPSTMDMPPPGPPIFEPTGLPPGIRGPSSHEGYDSFAGREIPSAPQEFYRTTSPPPEATRALPAIPPQVPQASHHYQPPPQQTARSTVPPAAAPAQRYGGGGGGSGSGSAPSHSYNTDDMTIVQAQKHAKWAISALNFEDVPTAVRELQAALASLGAR